MELEEAIEVGRLLFEAHLIDGASGNMSFKSGDDVLITRSGAPLYALRPEDFVPIDDSRASSDRLVHAKIYEETSFKAVLHCHGVFNVVLGLKFDRIVPLDLEGSLYFSEIEVVEGEFGSQQIAEAIAEVVKRKRVAVVRGHGIYAAASSIREAFNLASYVEHSCEVLYYSKLLDELHHRKGGE